MQQFNNSQSFGQPQQLPPNQMTPNFQNPHAFNQQNPQLQNYQNPSYHNHSQPLPAQSVVNTTKQQPKQVKPKKSVFSLKNVLITLLSLYSIFSFCWIAILYVGADGNKVCIEDNIICQISVPTTKQAAVAVSDNIETKNQLVKQKGAKNFVKDIWQNQAILNDNLVTRQQSVEKSIDAFTAYIQNYIRFINDKPEFLKGFSKTEMENKKTDIQEQLANLKLLQDNNYQNKINNQKQINELYQELGERQDNSFVAQREDI
jgi:hypothetical protein